VTPPAAGLDGLIDLLDIEDIDVDLFRSRHTGEPGHRLFGGQVAAQALVAAERTTDAAPHSLHGYFLRPGDTARPVILRVDRLQDGRTFRRRRVTATQGSVPILCLEASFSTDGSAAGAHASPPPVPGPDSCPPLSRGLRGGGLQPRQAFELRAVAGPDEPARFSDDVWFRANGPVLPGGRVSPAALLTYISDMTFVSAILRHGPRREIAGMTSLDHVMWFHNEVRLDDWLLYAKSSPAAGELRGLAQGGIFHRDGTLIASVAQEGLIHAARPGQQGTHPG
jgi:acyl-CoA thioesterase II